MRLSASTSVAEDSYNGSSLRVTDEVEGLFPPLLLIYFPTMVAYVPEMDRERSQWFGNDDDGCIGASVIYGFSAYSPSNLVRPSGRKKKSPV